MATFWFSPYQPIGSTTFWWIAKYLVSFGHPNNYIKIICELFFQQDYIYLLWPTEYPITTVFHQPIKPKTYIKIILSKFRPEIPKSPKRSPKNLPKGLPKILFQNPRVWLINKKIKKASWCRGTWAPPTPVLQVCPEPPVQTVRKPQPRPFPLPVLLLTLSSPSSHPILPVVKGYPIGVTSVNVNILLYVILGLWPSWTLIQIRYLTILDPYPQYVKFSRLDTIF